VPDTVRDSNSTSLRGPAYQLDADPMRGFQMAAKNAQAQLALQYAVVLFERQQEEIQKQEAEITRLRAEFEALVEAMPVRRGPGRPRKEETDEGQPEREPEPANL
jgi:hypothetical protein